MLASHRREPRSPRAGRPDDIASMAAYLLSDDGAWVNGQVWSVNGGRFLELRFGHGYARSANARASSASGSRRKPASTASRVAASNRSR